MSARRNQADCLAGATLSKSVQDGNLTVEDGDMEEITAFLIDFADGDTHGTPEQQVGLFIFGYDSRHRSVPVQQGRSATWLVRPV
jgi:predicted metalloprotease